MKNFSGLSAVRSIETHVMNLHLMIGVILFGLTLLPASQLEGQNQLHTGNTNNELCNSDSFKGLSELSVFVEPVPKNQGITNDGKYLYVSPDHHTIEKRNISDFKLIASATYPDKIGGLFYDSVRDEILTCSGQYTTGGAAFINRIDKNTLSEIASINISKHTKHGVNAIVRIGNKIYVGETAVNYDTEPKHWYSFDLDFNFIESVFSHPSSRGSYDWQDATMFDGKIFATDHNGVVYAFCILADGQLSIIGNHDSSGNYFEGITHVDELFLIWNHEVGFVTAKLK